LKKGYVIFILAFIGLSTAITLYLAHIGFLSDPSREFLVLMEGAVIAELIVFGMLEHLKKPTITIEPHFRMKDIGFFLTVKGRNILNARAFCDGNPVKWADIDAEKKETETKDLRAGEVSLFFPFEIILSEVRLASDRQIVGVMVIEKEVIYGDDSTSALRRVVYSDEFSVPRGRFVGSDGIGDWKPFTPEFHSSIRVTGEGIEEEINRRIDFKCGFSFQRKSESDSIGDISIDCHFKKIKRSTSHASAQHRGYSISVPDTN